MLPLATSLLLLFLLLCSCHPLRRSAIPCNFSGDREGKNSFFSAVLPYIISDAGFGCTETFPGTAGPQGVCPHSHNSVSGSLQLLLNNKIISTAC